MNNEEKLRRLFAKKLIQPGTRHFEVEDDFEKEEEKEYTTIDGVLYELDNTGNPYAAVKCSPDKKGAVVIPEGIVKINARVFKGSKIENLVLPSTLRVIEHAAFMGCKYLKNIDFGTGITKIGDTDEDCVFENCESLKEINIPPQVERIGEKAFSCCFALKTVKLNEGLLRIERSAFNCCYNLKEITFPKTLGSIGKYALSWIQKVNVQGKMLPWDIVLGVTTRGYPGLMPSIVEINYNGDLIFLPKCIVNDVSMKNLNNLVNAAALIEETWKYAVDDSTEKELVVKDYIYRKEKGEELPKSQEYINQNKQQVLVWLVNMDRTEDILSLIHTKALSTENIEYLLRLTENVNMRAYILDTAQKAGLYKDSLNI